MGEEPACRRRGAPIGFFREPHEYAVAGQQVGHLECGERRARVESHEPLGGFERTRTALANGVTSPRPG